MQASSSSGKDKSSAGVKMYNTGLVDKVKKRRENADGVDPSQDNNNVSEEGSGAESEEWNEDE